MCQRYRPELLENLFRNIQTEFSLWYAFKRVSCFLNVLEWHIPGVSQHGFEMVFYVSRWYIWRICIATRGVGTNSSIVNYAEEFISQQFFLKVLLISLRLNESALPHVNLSPRRVIDIKFRGANADTNDDQLLKLYTWSLNVPRVILPLLCEST